MRVGGLALALTFVAAACVVSGVSDQVPARPAEEALLTAARTEIVELHQFFESWFRGSVPRSPEAFDRFESVLGPEFVHIAPTGVLTERAALLDALRAAYGLHAEDGFRIRIENVRPRALADGIVLATYEEWQPAKGAEPVGRLSTALLRVSAAAPNGLWWAHVQETWLPGAGPRPVR